MAKCIAITGTLLLFNKYIIKELRIKELKKFDKMLFFIVITFAHLIEDFIVTLQNKIHFE